MKLKYNATNVCDDESLESEKGLEKTQAEEGKVEQGLTGMSLPRRRGKGEPGRAQGEFPPRHWTKSSLGKQGKEVYFLIWMPLTLCYIKNYYP